MVGNDERIQAQILELFHNSGLGGHSGIHATYQRISSILYWKGLWKCVREFIRKCQVCQQYKRENVATPGLLQPLPIPKSIFFYVWILLKDFPNPLVRMSSWW